MRILITAGPTREYLDDVRYITNASSGRMGYALAEAARDAGHEVMLVTGRVETEAPRDIDVAWVETTEEMRDTAMAEFDRCDGVIAAAAVCDYKPRERIAGKLKKTGGPVILEMIETDDVLAQLSARKGDRWVVGFALEAQNPRENALQKLRAKNCDVIVLNSPDVIGSLKTRIELLGRDGPIKRWDGTKSEVATALIEWIARELHQRSER